MVGGFLTLLLAEEQEGFESLYDLAISITEDEPKRVWEEEMQLATEDPNSLDNRESLLTTVGCSYFVGHMARLLQCDHCWNRASVIHASLGHIWLSASYSLLKMAWGTRIRYACLTQVHTWK